MAKKTKKRAPVKRAKSSQPAWMSSPIYGYIAVGLVFAVLILLLSGLKG